MRQFHLLLLSCALALLTTALSKSDKDYCASYRRQQRRISTVGWSDAVDNGGLEDRDYAPGGYSTISEPIDDSTIEIAVKLWFEDINEALTRFGNIQFWDVRAVTSMRNLFKDRTSFNDDITRWDVSCVENFHGMFWGASSFNQNLATWTPVSATNMHSMFRDAISFNPPSLPWSYMPDLLDMSYMFFGATGFKGDLQFFDTSNVDIMQSTFENSNYAGSGLTGWNVGSLTNSISMFENNQVFNEDIELWEPENLVYWERMFFNATSFNQTLCWHIGDEYYEPEVPNYQVFCETNGTFDKQCTDKTIISNSERRCVPALEEYIESFTDFFENILDFFNNLNDFFTNIFECFAPDVRAQVENVGWVAMKDLQVGDRVLTGSGEYQPIYSMFHSSKTKQTPYLQIHTQHSRSKDDVQPLEITANHMLHVVDYENPIPAWQVQVGDYVYIVDSDTFNYSRNFRSFSLATGAQQYLHKSRVVDIQNVIRNGLYNPLTKDGTIIVDGIVASTYASFLGTEHIHLFRENSTTSFVTHSIADINTEDGWKVMSHQDFIHILMSPYRAMCLYLPFDICNATPDDGCSTSKNAEEEKLDWYGHFGYLLLKLWLGQPVLLQAITFVLLLAFFGAIHVLLSPIGLSAALTFFTFNTFGSKRSLLTE